MVCRSVENYIRRFRTLTYLHTSSMSRRRFHGCSHVKESYTFLEKLGEGTFGEVHKAKQNATGSLVALKKIFRHNEKEGFPITSLREIRILKELDHENVIPLLEMSVESGDRAIKSRGSIYMVTPYMDHDLTGLLENKQVRFTLPQIKCYLFQLLQGINYLHQNHFLHRDIKASNILINNEGIVKLADFGLARHFVGDTPSVEGTPAATCDYTKMVVTRWYRPPELVLGETRYTPAIDMWGIGCVFGEMFKRRPILQGNSDLDQGNLIFQLVGPPTDESMPGYRQLPNSKDISFGNVKRQLEVQFYDIPTDARLLLSKLLTLNPLTRYSALGALQDPFFTNDPQPCLPQDIPKYAASHEYTSKREGRDRTQQVPRDINDRNGRQPGDNRNGKSSRQYDSRQMPSRREDSMGPPHRRSRYDQGPPRRGHDNRSRSPPNRKRYPSLSPPPPMRRNRMRYPSLSPPPPIRRRSRSRDGRDRERDRDRDRDRDRGLPPPPNRKEYRLPERPNFNEHFRPSNRRRDSLSPPPPPRDRTAFSPPPPKKDYKADLSKRLRPNEERLRDLDY